MCRVPSELRAAALAQLSCYPCVKVQPVSAEAVEGESGGFRVVLSDGRVIQARRLVLATGVEDVLPGIPGLAERWGRSVVHCPYCHGWERAGQTLGVLALNEWAVPQAVHVQRFSDDVTLYTSGEPALTAGQQDLLKARGVSIREGQLARLEGPGASLERLVFADGSTSACQGLFCHAPTRQRSDLAARLGCRLLDDDAVEVNEFGQTTRPGLRVFSWGAGRSGLGRIRRSPGTGRPGRRSASAHSPFPQLVRAVLQDRGAGAGQ